MWSVLPTFMEPSKCYHCIKMGRTYECYFFLPWWSPSQSHNLWCKPYIQSWLRPFSMSSHEVPEFGQQNYTVKLWVRNLLHWRKKLNKLKSRSGLTYIWIFVYRYIKSNNSFHYRSSWHSLCPRPTHGRCLKWSHSLDMSIVLHEEIWYYWEHLLQPKHLHKSQTHSTKFLKTCWNIMKPVLQTYEHVWGNRGKRKRIKQKYKLWEIWKNQLWWIEYWPLKLYKY